MEVRSVETSIHGRYLYEPRSEERLLVGFHGYAENGEKHMAELRRIPGNWSLLAIQALRTFYAGRTGEVIANWMTSEDRELAIADNIAYVRRVLDSLPKPRTLVFLGFSQGASMAFRAAAHIPSAGVIALGGDLPPDVREAVFPEVLLARGARDDWYTDQKMQNDLAALRRVTPLVFDGGHEFSDDFRKAAGEFLSRVGG